MGNWDKKTWAAAHAKQVIAYIDQHYAGETEHSVNCTVWFPEMGTVPHAAPLHPETEIEVRQETTVDAIFAESRCHYLCGSKQEDGAKVPEHSGFGSVFSDAPPD